MKNLAGVPLAKVWAEFFRAKNPKWPSPCMTKNKFAQIAKLIMGTYLLDLKDQKSQWNHMSTMFNY